ncbi:MAG: sulfite exporter TauE/SafE family protein [Clostridia bacterium]|nr:sulfite exporter TauE/SafE family protein [Clostridia bacterium]
MTEEFLLIVLVCTLASFGGAFVQRVSGFGYGIFVMMFFPYVLMHTEATALSGFVSLVSAAYVAFRLRKQARWKAVWLPLLSYVITNTVTTKVIVDLDTALLSKILGVALILLSLYFFFFSAKIKIRDTKTNALIAGGLSGILSGAFSMGGPPVVVYYLNSSKDNDEYIATIQCFFIFSNIISTFNRAINGFFTPRVLWLLLPTVLITFLANYLGKKTYGRIRPDMLKKVVYAFMAVSGVIALF